MTASTGLSRRQIEVKNLILDGRSNREIATLLSIKVDTVKVYASVVFRKLGVKNSRGLAAAEIASLRAHAKNKKEKIAT